MPKTNDKRDLSGVSTARDGRRGQTARRVPVAAKSGAVTVPQAPPEPSQIDLFQRGMRLFHARQFPQARESFLAAMKGADRAVAHRAGLHAGICERRLEPGMELNTPEDHYNYAVTLMNTREFVAAQQHLRTALEANASADHVLYALAACQSLAGDLPGAYENLKRAIDLQPSNRVAARQDPDFASAAGQATFARLFYPDRNS